MIAVHGTLTRPPGLLLKPARAERGVGGDEGLTVMMDRAPWTCYSAQRWAVCPAELPSLAPLSSGGVQVRGPPEVIMRAFGTRGGRRRQE